MWLNLKFTVTISSYDNMSTESDLHCMSTAVLAAL